VGISAKVEDRRYGQITAGSLNLIPVVKGSMKRVRLTKKAHKSRNTSHLSPPSSAAAGEPI